MLSNTGANHKVLIYLMNQSILKKEKEQKIFCICGILVLKIYDKHFLSTSQDPKKRMTSVQVLAFLLVESCRSREDGWWNPRILNWW
jgi:hypothetical protein